MRYNTLGGREWRPALERRRSSAPCLPSAFLKLGHLRLSHVQCRLDLRRSRIRRRGSGCNTCRSSGSRCLWYSNRATSPRVAMLPAVDVPQALILRRHELILNDVTQHVDPENVLKHVFVFLLVDIGDAIAANRDLKFSKNRPRAA